jgi:hypothetical protein
MNPAKLMLLLGLVGTLSAEPLRIYEDIGEGVTAEMKEKVRASLSRGNGEGVKTTIHSMHKLDDPDISASFPKGEFYRVSWVVFYPVSKHAAMLDGVLGSIGETEILLPMSGDRSEFEELLKTLSFRLEDSAKAGKLAKAYAAIYRLNPVGEPKVERVENKFSIEFEMAPDKEGGKRSLSVSLVCDKEMKVTKVTPYRLVTVGK